MHWLGFSFFDPDPFDPTRWDHWLLIFSFLAVSLFGLWASWQWNRR